MLCKCVLPHCLSPPPSPNDDTSPCPSRRPRAPPYPIQIPCAAFFFSSHTCTSTCPLTCQDGKMAYHSFCLLLAYYPNLVNIVWCYVGCSCSACMLLAFIHHWHPAPWFVVVCGVVTFNHNKLGAGNRPQSLLPQELRPSLGLAHATGAAGMYIYPHSCAF